MAGAETDSDTSLVDGTLKGKQRNTFGNYYVINKDLYTIEIHGYGKKGAASDVTNELWYTSPTEASI